MGCRANTGRRHSCRLGRQRGWRGRPRHAANAVGSRRPRSPGERCQPPAARPAGGIARPSRGEPLAPALHLLFALFYQVEIRHRQLRRYRRRLARRDHAAGGAAGLQPTGFVPWERTAAGCVRCTAATRSVADQYQLDSLAEQRLGLAREECRGGNGRLVAAGDPAAERDCPTGPFRTAAHVPAASVVVRAHPSSTSPSSGGRAIPLLTGSMHLSMPFCQFYYRNKNISSRVRSRFGFSRADPSTEPSQVIVLCRPEC